MPGPGSKNRNSKAKKGGQKSNTFAPTTDASTTTVPTASSPSPSLCHTLLEDEITRCGQPATTGKPGERRCKTHHSQYVKLYKKYKAAGEKVDQIKNGGQFPIVEQITALNVVKEKLKWLDSYVEAMRVERYGRMIHSGRFFLKVDAGHKTRINILAKDMDEANTLRKELGKRALELYSMSHPEVKWSQPLDLRFTVEAELKAELKEATDALANNFSSGSALAQEQSGETGSTGNLGSEEDDLIDLRIRAEKRNLLAFFEPFLEFESRKPIYDALKVTEDGEIIGYMTRVMQATMAQFLRRAVFYDHSLYYKALNKTSFRDLFLSEEFTIEEALSLAARMRGMTGFALLWLKDSVCEAVQIVRKKDQSITAQVGDIASRINILGGWIYKTKHTKRIPDEVWWYIYAIADIEPNTENRMVRLCNNYDDIIGFLSMAAFRPKQDPPPYSKEKLASSVPRMHLSISGIVIADMVSPAVPLGMSIVPTTRRATKPGNIVWGEMELRAYMFGAVRLENEPFTERFLSELRARPDLYQLVIWDETKPDSTAEEFGSGEGGKVLPQCRSRNFEAPFRQGTPNSGHGPWNVHRTAQGVLFAPNTNGNIQGYITSIRRRDKGWFFRFKEFPVRYLLIIDTMPNRDVSALSHHVAWAALRAGGYATGEFTRQKYKKASDQLFEKESKRRLSWMPSFFGGWTVHKMAEASDEESNKTHAAHDKYSAAHDAQPSSHSCNTKPANSMNHSKTDSGLPTSAQTLEEGQKTNDSDALKTSGNVTPMEAGSSTGSDILNGIRMAAGLGLKGLKKVFG